MKELGHGVLTYTLLAGLRAVDGGPLGLEVRPVPPEVLASCGTAPDGALVLRPDGVVGARWQHPPTAADLRAAAEAVLRPGPVLRPGRWPVAGAASPRRP